MHSPIIYMTKNIEELKKEISDVLELPEEQVDFTDKKVLDFIFEDYFVELELKDDEDFKELIPEADYVTLDSWKTSNTSGAEDAHKELLSKIEYATVKDFCPGVVAITLTKENAKKYVQSNIDLFKNYVEEAEKLMNEDSGRIFSRFFNLKDPFGVAQYKLNKFLRPYAGHMRFFEQFKDEGQMELVSYSLDELLKILYAQYSGDEEQEQDVTCYAFTGIYGDYHC